MRNLFLCACLIPALGACTSNTPAFTRMTYAEIVEYNASVDYADQVVCFRALRTGTNIKRRYCETIEQMHKRQISGVQQINTATLGTANSFSID